MASERVFNTAQQIPLDLHHRSAYGREDFLIGPENKNAVGWVDRWPEWPAPALFITGPAACGKTHIAAVWKDCSSAEFVPVKAFEEKWSAEKISHIADNLVLDHVDLWFGDQAFEEMLFHLYNIFKEEGRSLLLTSRMAPSHIDFLVPDLASRLRAAPLALVESPGDMLLASILIKQFSDRQLSITNDVVKYILPRMERSFVAARDLVARSDRLALAQKSKISVPLIRQVLTQMMDEE